MGGRVWSLDFIVIELAFHQDNIKLSQLTGEVYEISSH